MSSNHNFPIPNKAGIIINKPELAHGHLAGENETIRVRGAYAVIFYFLQLTKQV